jgi:hypothetical protein
LGFIQAGLELQHEIECPIDPLEVDCSMELIVSPEKNLPVFPALAEIHRMGHELSSQTQSAIGSDAITSASEPVDG